MKLFCKRGLSLLLTLVLFAGLLSGLSIDAFAAETTLAERQQAIVAVALAYFDKGHSVQYDGGGINSVIARTDYGKTRSTYESSPEWATPNETAYTVCSDYPCQVYYEAFRYKLLGNEGKTWTGTLSKVRDDPMVVWYFDASEGKNIVTEVERMFTLAQPGDIFTSFTGEGGHTMIWAGDVFGDGVQRIIHSGGRRMNETEWVDNREYLTADDPDVDTRIYANFGATTNGGTIRISDAEEYIRERYMKKSRKFATLLRPALNMTDETYPMRPATKYRMTHPGLSIDRTLSKTRFNSVYPGETVTMTIKLSNDSQRYPGILGDDSNEDFDESLEDTEATQQSLGQSATVQAAKPTADANAIASLQAAGQNFSVRVTEKAPKGAKIITPFAGATVSGDTMTINVPLAAGESKTLTAEFMITAERGEKVVFDGGKVGDIPSNSIPVMVGGKKLTKADTDKLTAIAEHQYNRTLNDKNANNSSLANVVYNEILGWNVQIPSFSQIASKFTKQTVTPAGKAPRVFLQENEVAQEDLPMYKMMVQTFWGGQTMWNMYGWQRCSDPRDMHLEPGDVIVRSMSPTDQAQSEQMIYLGNGKYLCYDAENNSYPIKEEPEFFRSLFYKIFFVLRPTLTLGKTPGKATVTAENGVARPGGKATVQVNLSDNTGIAGALMSLHYDPALTLQSIETGNSLQELHFTPPGDLTANPVSLLWDGMEADATNGTILTLTFGVPSGTKTGSYDVALSCGDGDVYDGDMDDVGVYFVSGKVKVKTPSVGDISADDLINAKDVTVLRRYLAGGYGIETALETADCNGDGVVNAKDVTILRRYLAGGYNIRLHQPGSDLKPDETTRIPLP